MGLHWPRLDVSLGCGPARGDHRHARLDGGAGDLRCRRQSRATESVFADLSLYQVCQPASRGVC